MATRSLAVKLLSLPDHGGTRMVGYSGVEAVQTPAARERMTARAPATTGPVTARDHAGVLLRFSMTPVQCGGAPSREFLWLYGNMVLVCWFTLRSAGKL